MIKNPSSSAEDVGSIPGRGSKILHALGQLRPRTAAVEPVSSGACKSLLERSPRTAMKDSSCHN